MNIFNFDFNTIGIYDRAAWAVILGLSLMVLGGLMMWTYRVRPSRNLASIITGMEAEATYLFHTKLSRWFLCYGGALIVLGLAVLAWAMLVLL